ncbi:H/ACA ribonucleoprotein complex non-core subunit NAF1 [Prorops nasuta]|uniref:H/ACA ribonucleoprotein complex non-core subunit NAF1 n=1 Tax=Prorops nasuta TaxID=863751 RepID=UPI0034CF6CA2
MATLNEWDELPPIEDLKISVPEVLCDPFGEVAWTVDDTLIVVKPIPGKPTLNLDSVLFVERGKRTLGKIYDVFGQVTDPHYCVRFNNIEHVKEKDIKIGMSVYYCPNTEYTSLVFLSELQKMKGSDAIGEDEPPDFSDDEEESAYYEALKQQKQQGQQNEDNNVTIKRRRTNPPAWKCDHPWNRPRSLVNQNINNNIKFNVTQLPPNPWTQNTYQQSSWGPVPRTWSPNMNYHSGGTLYPKESQPMLYHQNSTMSNTTDTTSNDASRTSAVPSRLHENYQYNYNHSWHWLLQTPPPTAYFGAPWMSLPPPPPPPPPPSNN